MPPLDKVKADLASGLTAKDLAVAYGVPGTTVKTFIRRNKLSKKRYVTYPPDDQIIAALEARESIHSMAGRFGIHKDSLWRRIYDRRLREKAVIPAVARPEPTGLQPSPAKVIVTAPDGSKISVPRIPTIHGHYEARP